MRSLFLLCFLLATCMVSIRADDSSSTDPTSVVATTTASTSASSTASDSASTSTASTTSAATTGSSSASSTASDSPSTPTASTTASTTSAATTVSSSASSTASGSQSTMTTSTTSTSTTVSSSASPTPTSSAATNAFHWGGSEIAALVILLAFLVFGIAFIAHWQVRRMIAKRRDNATLGAYAKHKTNPSGETAVTRTGALVPMNSWTDHSSHNPPSAFQHAIDDLDREPGDLFAASFQNSTPVIPGPSTYAFPDSIRHSRSPSPHSEAVQRPLSQNTERRSFSFDELPKWTIGDMWVEKPDRMSAFRRATQRLLLH